MQCCDAFGLIQSLLFCVMLLVSFRYFYLLEQAMADGATQIAKSAQRVTADAMDDLEESKQDGFMYKEITEWQQGIRGAYTSQDVAAGDALRCN